MKKTLFALLAFIMMGAVVYAETTEKETSKKEKKVTYNEKGEIIKTGINLGPLPVVAFDADRGFQFGALMNIYDFGNGITHYS